MHPTKIEGPTEPRSAHAFRKLARVWHPDRYKGVKARAERKMRECAEAKEVLVRQLRCSEHKGR